MESSFAKFLRQNLTDAETQLWQHLRRRSIFGCKFRRQAPIGKHVVDSACFEACLIVEADGEQHDVRRDYDEHRTVWFNSQGFKVMRFRNNEILREMDAVLETIRQELPAHTAHPNLPPQGGKGQESVSFSPFPLMREGGKSGARAEGFALVSALAFLLVITLLGVSLFLGVNLQQKAAGNSLQKTRALELAKSATMAAERWLAATPKPNPQSCTADVIVFRVCALPPTKPSQPDQWGAGKTTVDLAGLTFSQSGGAGNYYAKPGVWISLLGRATMGAGRLYRIDAYAQGGNSKSLVATETVFYVGDNTHRSTPAQNLGH